MQRVDAVVHGRSITLLGSIPGYVPDGTAVAETLEQLRPRSVALGIPPEDLPALEALAASDDPEALIPERQRSTPDLGHGAPGLEAVFIDTTEEQEDDDEGFAAIDPVHAHLLALLERFGPTRLPSPDLEAAHAWARAHDAPIHALDLDDETHADVYVKANRLWDVIRHNRHTKRLLANQFTDAADADALAIAFDGQQTRLPSLQVVEEAREAHMAARLAEIDATVAIVPLARLAGIVEALARQT